MTAYIHTIATAAPAQTYTQDFARDSMTGWLPGRRAQRLIRGIYDNSGIETRHSVLSDFQPVAAPRLFHADAGGRIVEPTTGARNAVFAAEARALVVDVSRRAVAQAPELRPADITHVITASCTGFYNPGPDLDVIRGLGLSESVERYHLGFMGCYAAFPALRMAEQFCRARPGAVVLVVCVELCTLHMQLREDRDSLLANALFADGAAAALVSARPPARDSGALALQSFASALAPEGAGDMAWTIGDRGFDIRLSSYVPEIIGANIRAIVDGVLGDAGRVRADIDAWAVHPGGRAILDKVEAALALAPHQLADARAVLRDFGNMSSATVLFVLGRMLAGAAAAGAPTRICAMAFGPGLTIETALLECRPAAVCADAKEEPAAHAVRAP